MLAVPVLAAFATSAAAAPPSTTKLVLDGFGAVSVIHDERDGVVTEGYLFGFDVNHGAEPDIPYDHAIAFFGSRTWTATGRVVMFSGAAPAAYSANGLAGARLTGELVANPFWDGDGGPIDALPPITIDADVSYTGVGATHSETWHYADGSAGSVYVSYESRRWRYADVAGSASVDGNAATVDTAQLLADTAGEFDLVAMPSR